jgi:hypothetical protein
MHPSVNDIGAYITTAVALDHTAIAGSAINGPAYDRFAHRPLNLSTKVGVGFLATIPSGGTLTVGFVLQDSANGSDWDPFDVASGVAVVSGLNSGAQQRGTVEFSANILGARQYIRSVVTPVLSSGSGNVFGMYALGGGELIPVDGAESA